MFSKRQVIGLLKDREYVWTCHKIPSRITKGLVSLIESLERGYILPHEALISYERLLMSAYRDEELEIEWGK